MKKIFLILFAFLFLPFVEINFASAEDNIYGKVKNSEVYFYSSLSSASGLFKLPYSYFVSVISVEGEFYQVTYKDLIGFVKKEDVTLMRGTPSSPYLNSTFTNYVAYSLYENPNSSSTSLADIEEDTVLNFYGEMEGEEVSSRGNTWYYASANLNGEIVRGYIYSEVASTPPETTINKETFEEVSEEALEGSSTSFSNLSTGTKVLLIIAITVPSIFILFFLVKKPTKQKRKTEKKAIRKIQHGDYFEFDDSDLN